MTTRLIAQSNCSSRTNKRLFSKEKEVSDFIFSRQGKGASIQKVAANLRLTYEDTKHIFAQLIKAGEIFRKKGKVYCSTAWAMAFDSRPFVERLREELERDLFGPEPTPRVRAFLAEFSAAAKLGLNIDESFHFAQRRILKSEPQGVGL